MHTFKSYQVRTNPGLEPVLMAEIRSLFDPEVQAAAASRGAGWVSVERSAGASADTHAQSIDWGRMRCAHEVLGVVHTCSIEAQRSSSAESLLRGIQDAAERAPWPELAEGARFAVRSRRTGAHPIASPDIERRVGAVLHGAWPGRVDLSHPDVTFRADLTNDQLTLGVVVHAEQPRFSWLYRPRVTLHPVVAAACLQLAREPDPYTPGSGTLETIRGLLDPFCGSGTIPIEAADQMRKPGSGNPPAPIWASDRSPEAVAGTRANLHANGVPRAICTRVADATNLQQHYRGHGISHIVCNPPYGVRLGKRVNFEAFYRSFLTGALTILPPGGRVVLMSSRRRAVLNRVIQTTPAFSLRGVHLIETGGVFPGIFVMERVD